MLFDPVRDEPDFRQTQLDMLKFWEETDAFEALLRKNADGPIHSFIDGPITANNPMGVHHARGRTYKDVYLRYKAMQGYQQRYQNGFDCHGLWVEVEVEKELGLKTKRDIEEYGLDKFSRACRERVEKFSKLQLEQSIELGQWMSWGEDYYTLTDTNIEYIWHFLKGCFEKGWLYRAYRPMPWCARCGTSLSQHEMLDSYKDITHTAVFIKLPLGDGAEKMLVWTTTPWTLAANVALAVGENLEYSKVKQNGELIWVATERLDVLKGEYEVVEVLKGQELAGRSYCGPFDEVAAQEGIEHKVVVWDQVEATEGTGVVHIAPGCGLEDYELSKEIDLPVIGATDEAGLYLDTFGDMSGEYVSEVAETVFESLEAKGYLYKTESYEHRYPHCWRCSEELIFRLVDEWFIGVDEIRQQLLDANGAVDWHPGFAGARMANWLEGMGDWCISRKRFWGLPLPFYVCDCGETTVIGSLEELKGLATGPIEDLPELHRPWIDDIEIACPKCGASTSRVVEVGDCWLDAGIVPFSTLGYLTTRDVFDTWYPADLVVEMQEQIRLWFYALLIMGVAIDGRAPYKNCLTYEKVLAEDGREMHKSWGNAIWLDDAQDKMGGDVMRWSYLTQSTDQPQRFGFAIGRDIVRRLTLLWNSYRFLIMYANVDEPTLGKYDEPPTEGLALADKWILSRTYQTVADVRKGLDGYEVRRAADAIEGLWDDISRWYIRRSRRRMWKAGDSADKQAAYNTLYHVVCTLIRTAAPFMPFMTEEMYQTLVHGVDASAPESVHHAAFPEERPELVDAELEAVVEDIQQVINLASSARNDAQMRVRQPLSELLVVMPEESHPWLERFLGDIVDEVNVKEVRLVGDLSEVKTVKANPNRRALGPVFRQKSQAVAAAITELPDDRVQPLAAGESITIEVDGEPAEITPEMVEIESVDREGMMTAGEGKVSIALNTTLTGELIREGLARDIVRRIQVLRKDADLELTDRIHLKVSGDEGLTSVCAEYADTIQGETLAETLEIVDAAEGEAISLNGMEMVVGLAKV